jgi:predicted transcriptional regulator
MLNIGEMKTADLIRLFGGVTRTARVLGITKSAVSQWGEDVPELRVYQIREKRPTIDAEIAALVPRNNESRAA